MKYLASALALILASLAGSGCHSHDDRTIVSATTDTYWYLSYEDVYETEEQEFLWNTTLVQGEVVLRLVDFHHGTIRVRIYDDAGLQIYDEFFVDSHHYYHDYDDDITVVSLTQPATPGTWRIRTSAVDFTGHLYVTIQQP